MPKIFISYRRSDSATFSGRIYDHLAQRYKPRDIFKDVDSIPPGVDFPTYIDQTLARSDVLLVVIGPQWLDAVGSAGQRLANQADFVRVEIETGLRLGLSILPLLVDGANMPGADALPESLRPLTRLNALVVRNDPDFRHDMQRVIRAINALPTRRPPRAGLWGHDPRAPRSALDSHAPLTPASRQAHEDGALDVAMGPASHPTASPARAAESPVTRAPAAAGQPPDAAPAMVSTPATSVRTHSRGTRWTAKTLGILGAALLVIVVSVSSLGVALASGRLSFGPATGSPGSAHTADTPTATATFAPTATATPWLSAELKASIKIPQGWTEGESCSGGSCEFDFSSASDGSGMHFYAGRDPKATWTDASYVSGYGNFFNTDSPPLSGYPTTMTIGGTTWQRRDFDVSGATGKVHQTLLACHHNGDGYDIALTAPEAEFASDYTHEFLPMLKSWRFLP